MRSFRLPGGGIACGPDTGVECVVVRGRHAYFTFDRRFGPLLTDKRGDPLKRQPGDRDPFWPPFNVWLKAWLAANPEPAKPEDPSEKWDKR